MSDSAFAHIISYDTVSNFSMYMDEFISKDEFNNTGIDDGSKIHAIREQITKVECMVRGFSIAVGGIGSVLI